MSSFTFVHAADIHLDTPFTGLRRMPEAFRDVVRKSTFLAFDRLIEVCITEKADFLLIAGDVYDAADRSLRAQLYFRQGMRRLHEHGVNVYVIHGNHDPDDGKQARITWPNNVHFFKTEQVTHMLFCKEEKELARIYGISYPRARIEENYASLFKRADSLYSIAMLHTNVDASGLHANYAPCTKQELIGAGFDYWALGHVHTRAVLNKEPYIVYPGNTQGRSAVETGERGCYVVKVDKGTTSLAFRPLDAVRWEEAVLDISQVSGEPQLFEAIEAHREEIRCRAEGKPVILRLNIQGTSSFYRVLADNGYISQLLQALNEEEEGREDFVYLADIENRTLAAGDRIEVASGDDLLGDLLRQGAAIGEDSSQLQDFVHRALSDVMEHYQLKKYVQYTEVEHRDILKQAQELAVTLLRPEGDSHEN
ncbi:DNA repair exonuclease [Aneurinibacillus sp. Ricciae_BoGa-3]|uniref:metallophosphoesterase family protein n=1 Tax=Aneurinibacillus sp. Ricciae_BoGa-3 TaxID=3022697 RepID=UPI00233FE850|nr:DNA repair exonuclease [Aneurinibacillus sp. Ricciae_BoGa-3]WCK55852.1 DNA repair exonuclease [Aneurinibacillus sp. Ricciae_BoGa-3]